MTVLCPGCPTCEATARVEAALKDTDFEDAMVALMRVVAKHLAPAIRIGGTGMIAEAEACIIRQLRDDIAFELKGMATKAMH